MYPLIILKMFNFLDRIFISVATLFIFLLKFQSSASPSVIIVGAGPSGIAAASRLIQNNVTNITILEAEDRIGGRIYSVEFGDAVVDLGAEYCHGEKDNIVYEMAKDLNLLRPGKLSLDFRYSSKTDIHKEFVRGLYNLFLGIYYKDEKEDGITLGDYIIKSYNESVMKEYGNDPDKMKLAEECLVIMKKYASSVEGAFSWFDVSAESDYEECEGNDMLDWKGKGYKTILDMLMKKYPNPEEQLPVENKILLNKEVIEVIWDSSDNLYATLKCKDGTVYSANHVIFTPSLGVLKSNFRSLFTPQLPKLKQEIIEVLGIGAVSKAILHFPFRWWPQTNFTDFIFIWSKEDQKALTKEFPMGPINNGTSWLINLIGLFNAGEENPNVLIAWFAGELVPGIEKCSDNLIIEGILFILNKFLKDEFPNVTKPNSMIRNNWYSNPHFRGTYSFQTIKSRQYEESPEVILSKPLMSSHGKQTLLFAGEATHPIYYSTVHGAIETGFREAQRIIDLYN